MLFRSSGIVEVGLISVVDLLVEFRFNMMTDTAIEKTYRKLLEITNNPGDQQRLSDLWQRYERTPTSKQVRYFKTSNGRKFANFFGLGG